MATTIVDQTIEYDNSARAWAQMRQDGMAVELVRYHDSEEDAVYAALPADLQAWVDTRRLDGDGGARALRAAALIANEQIKPDPQAYGIYYVPFEREENGMRYQGQHIIDVRRKTCTCEDRRYRSAWCKHILAARHLFEQWQAKHMSRRPTLRDLARATIEEHQHDEDWETQIIWKSADGTRYASIVQGGSGKPEDPLFLLVSGHAAAVMIGRIDYDPWPEMRWVFIDNLKSYEEWCKEISG